MLGALKTVLADAYEGGLRSILSGLLNRKHVYMYVPEANKQAVVQDRITCELDTTIKFFLRKKFDQFKEEARQRNKCDYSWLISIPAPRYKIPSLERMEIESLAYQVKPEHVGECIRQFRARFSGTTTVEDIPSLMIHTLRKILGEYESERYNSEISRPSSVLRRMRSEPKVYPSNQIPVVIANSNSGTSLSFTSLA